VGLGTDLEWTEMASRGQATSIISHGHANWCR